jgi:hypothetical protein
MAYYDALIAKWATLTPGTTAVKLAALNAENVTGSVPTMFTVTAGQIHANIVLSEFSAASAANQALVRDMFSIPGDIPVGELSPGVNTLARAVIVQVFGAGTQTRANFVGLAKGVSQPWWKANGYTGPFNENDLLAAGGLT